MATYEVLSMLSVVAMVIAFWTSGLPIEINIIFILQVVAYLLLAVSSWLINVHSAAFALMICAITLTLKMLHRFSVHVMLLFFVVALTGGLIVNNSGWVGILPILAALGVIYRHTYRHTMPSILEILDIGSEEEREENRVTLLSKMDNANRMPAHAIDLFLSNIVGVMIWGVYAWQISDRCMMVWRSVMLAINMIDYTRRIWPSISIILANAIPDPNRYKRKRYPGKKHIRNWVI